MKALLPLLFFIGLIPLRAEEASPPQAVSEALRTSKIEKLELNKATFEEALAKVQTEWIGQHPSLDFPVSIAEYERDKGFPPLITMTLNDVPFIKALKYIGDVSHRRLVEKSDLLMFEDYGLIIEDWIIKSFSVSKSLLSKLGLGKAPTPDELAMAYARYGVRLADWMKISYHEDGIMVVIALEKQQEQIAGINHLFSQGFVIRKDVEQEGGTDQPATATAPESKAEGGDTPRPESKPASQ